MFYSTQPIGHPIFELNAVSYQITRLIVSLAMFFLLATGIILSVSFTDPKAFSNPGNGVLTWFEAFYFVIVTGTHA